MPRTGTGIVYETRDGTGTPIVFVHGWLGSRAYWDRVIRRIDTGNPLLWYDQRCHGDSDCSRFDMDTLVADLDRVLDDAGHDRPALVGHSMGGMVALRYTADHPDRVSGLFLAATSASTPDPAVESPRFFLEELDRMDRGDWADMILDNYMGEQASEEIRAASREQLIAADEVPVRCGLQLMIDYDVRDRLDAVDVPVSVVGGRHDRAITPEKVDELAALLGVDPVMLDTTHEVVAEEPGRVAALIEAFIGEVDA